MPGVETETKAPRTRAVGNRSTDVGCEPGRRPAVGMHAVHDLARRDGCAGVQGDSTSGTDGHADACPGVSRRRCRLVAAAAVDDDHLVDLPAQEAHGLLDHPRLVQGRDHDRDARGCVALQACEAAGAGDPAARRAWTNCTAIAPSPTAAAQRFVDPDRTSPAAKTPGRLVSSRYSAFAAAPVQDETVFVAEDRLAEPLGAGRCPEEEEQERERQPLAVRERHRLEPAVVAVERRDLGAIPHRDPVALEVVDEVVRHRLAQVGAAMKERHQRARRARARSPPEPAELPPPTTPTRDAPQSWASGGPAA